MISYKSGDVVIVEFVFSERTGHKRRPALVISSDEYHSSRREAIIAAITSNIKRSLAGDTKIEGWKDAGLNHPSKVAGLIQTIKADMIIRKIGRFSGPDLQNVRKNLKKIIEL